MTSPEPHAGGSVTRWLADAKAGRADAAQPLWGRYFERLVGLARQRLSPGLRRVADEEDIALSAFDSFYRAAAGGRFPQLLDRDDLWRLLAVIVARKALCQVRNERRQKRGGGAVLPEADLACGADSDRAALDQFMGTEPTPESAALLADECRRLLARLDDAELQAVALLKMEGCTTAEVAARVNRAPRSVERMLQLIRRLWSEEEPL